MISNRRGARPSSSPIEHLREFAINTSKGIDITQSPINGNTVAHSKNLIVNPDGSLSLRKPLKYVSSTVGKSFQLFDGTKMELIDEHELYIGDQTTSIQLEWYSYKGERHAAPFANASTDLFKDNSKISVLNLNTSSIICNAEILIGIFNKDDNIIDTALYDIEDEKTFAVPRYVKISKGKLENGNEGYTLTVMNPEPNELRFGTNGEFALDPNMVLDNPYAIKDMYGATYPNSKGVVGYGYSKLQGTTPISEPITKYGSHVSLHAQTPPTTKTFSIPSMENASSITPYEHTLVFQHKLSLGYSVETTLDIKFYNQDLGSSGNYYDIAGIFTGSVTIAPMFESAKVDVGAGAVAEAPAVDVRVRIKTYDASGVLTNNIQHSMAVATQTFRLTDGDAVALDKIEVPLEFSNDRVWRSASSSSRHEVTIELVEGFVSMAAESTHAVDVTCLDLDTVAQLTESVKNTRFRPVVSTQDLPIIVLKAFGNIPLKTGTVFSYWATWYATYDGVTWVPVTSPDPDTSTYRMVVDADDGTAPFAAYYPFAGTDSFTPLKLSGNVYENRPDILPIAPLKGASPLQYKFRVVTLSDSPLTDVSDKPTYETETLISEVFYTVPFYGYNEFAHIEFDNAVYGNKLYHKKRIYSYGHEKFFNNIFVSGIDNFETLLYNVIDIDAKQSDTVTALVPWRDYLMSATTNSMYLHTPQDNGFLTKTVTTSLGIPKEDSDCCVPVLNGVIVKSNSMVYLIYPNAYAGTDSVLNVAPISQPVEEYLQDFEDISKEKPFAFSTESEYILMLPYTEKTICLRYNYTTRIWCMCEYPVRLYDYRINTVEDIRLYGKIPKKVSDTDFLEVYAEFEFDSDSELYADIIGETEVPIEFEWDSGQKTDNIATRKQFTESKIVFSTEDEIENFPMELIVAVDGDPNITRIDVRTDAPLIKTTESVGVLGTNLRLSENFSDPNVSKSGLIRQLIVRYSGRGRSVRHILRGVAKSPFRMYEAYVRYKLVDNKR